MSLCICNPAYAQRASINGMDGKLDRLLAGSPGINAHVMLFSQSTELSECGIKGYTFRKVNLGQQNTYQNFEVPHGQALLIHDISFTAYNNPGDLFRVGSTLRMMLSSKDVDGSHSQTIYSSPPVEVNANNKTGQLGANESLFAGVAIGPGRILCAIVVDSTAESINEYRYPIKRAILHGYLIPYSE